MRESSDIVKFIKEKAKETGFDGCGIASPSILQKDIDYLTKWLSDRKHGNIRYLEKNIEQKADPRKILGKAKSIIALVKNYFPSEKQNDSAHFKIAKYAYGNDYHKVLKSKATVLVQTMQDKFKKAEFKIFVDSNTILEKAWAARCGLGWIGKNTLLINKKLGSFMFICIILTDIELEYDELLENHCGNCNACIEACPAGAIEKPFQLNASKCISCLTIEDYPSEQENVQESSRGWIYGCDICQDVCPWNKDIPVTKEPAFKPNHGILRMTRNDWEKLDEKTFEKLFKNSAVKRIGFEKMKKNIENA